MSQEMAKAINDGLFNYEDELWDPSDDEAWVSWLLIYFFIYFEPLNLMYTSTNLSFQLSKLLWVTFLISISKYLKIPFGL